MLKRLAWWIMEISIVLLSIRTLTTASNTEVKLSYHTGFKIFNLFKICADLKICRKLHKDEPCRASRTMNP